MQTILWRKSYRVHHEVQLAPLLRDAVENGFHLPRDADVQRHHDRRLERARQRLDVLFGLVIEIGNGQIGAEGAEGGGTAPRYGLLVRYPYPQPFFAL